MIDTVKMQIDCLDQWAKDNKIKDWTQIDMNKEYVVKVADLQRLVSASVKTALDNVMGESKMRISSILGRFFGGKGPEDGV